MKSTWLMYVLAMKAVFLRDLRTYVRYPFNAFMGIIDPLVWMLPVVFMARAFNVNGEAIGFKGYTGTSDFIAFYVIGGVIGYYVSAVGWGIGFSLKNEMMQGVLETNYLTPVPPVVLLVGRSLWSLAVTTFRSVVGLILTWLLFRFSLTGQILPALAALVPVLIGLYGLGFGLAAAVLVTNDANSIIDMSQFAIGLLSGQQFPVQVLPRFLLAISLALPVTYGVDVVRGLLLGTKTLLPLETELWLLCGVMLVFVACGYLIFGAVSRRVRTTGKLGFH